ncbi:M23 family metallopeptidase [Aurantimonas sp. Leaf443]|uniref:M23 family metallopeptidase n=1 Tax=Aurantimonas sp. Leaf443 TaxID=1736378 RepID=UPI0006FE3A0F|nr:M23 family metallopeptidase [Aurantimonas sp. Leaf443]KQT83429.1 hypothetical protein ASG48_12780 [Aurantimonas sp. Leaf443]
MPLHEKTTSFGARRVPHTLILARGDSVRHVTIGHRTLLAAGVLACSAAAALLALPVLYVMGDDINATIAAGQRETASAYEQRITLLRAQLDMLKSRQVIAQKTVQTKVDVLLDQQEQLAERYDRLGPLLERAAATGLLPPPAPLPTARPGDAGRGDGPADRTAAAPSLLGFAPVASSAALDRVSALAPQPASTGFAAAATLREASDSMFGEIDRTVRAAEGQLGQVRVLAEEARRKAVRIATVLRAEGLATPQRLEAPARGIGGPFEPAPAATDFDESCAELETALDAFQQARDVADTLPLRQPMAASLVSSTFGVRPDPFLNRSALHAGIDYAVSPGAPVLSTAAGRVVSAGPSGGYGNLVEIDHGNGITTRYAHLARIDVAVGQSVDRGSALGASGSTGRSTGPHLHYEIRRDGQAIDPQRFFRIGERIAEIG